METKWHLQTTLEEVLPVFSPSSESHSGSPRNSVTLNASNCRMLELFALGFFYW